MSSKISKQVSRVRRTVIRLASEREKLPQSLFWSLFRSQVDDIREKKQKKQERREQWLSGEIESEFDEN